MVFRYTLFIYICFLSLCFAQEKKYYFYHPENNFGSDLLFNPLTLTVNGSFDILRNGAHTKNIFKQPYGKGYKNVLKNLGDPLTNINKYGWDTFISQEVWNFELNQKKSNFLPNFVDHTIGNGMQYAKLAEWFDYYNYPLPYLCSFAVTTFYQITNEAMENGRYSGPNIDPIADVYIFNVLGFALFSTDFIKHFFSEILPMYEWMLQPIYNVDNHYLENAGQQYIVRKELPFVNNLSGFVYWGLNGIAGLSYKYDDENSVSFGFGQVVNRINENIDNGLRFMNPSIDGVLAVFYDRNNSLLASLLLEVPRMPNARLNIYPGLFSIGGFSPGIYLGVGKWDNFIFGMSFHHCIPIGFGYGTTKH